MKRLLLLSLFSLTSVLSYGRSLIVLKETQTSFNDNNKVFIGHFIFDKSVEGISHKLNFINETVQIDFSGAEIKEGRKFQKVQKNKVKSLYMYQLARETLRVRVIYDGIKAGRFKGLVNVVTRDKTVTVKVQLPVENDVASKKGHVDWNSQSIIKAKSLERSLSQKMTINKKVSLSEEKTPLLKKQHDKKKSTESGGLVQMLLSLLAVAFLLAMSFLGIKRWLKNKKVQLTDSKIRVLTQHSVGSRKSLAIIRVAGETMLIGITNQNINMIKSLDFLDEEENYEDFSPEQVPDHLGQENLSDDFSIGGIREFVSKGLKGMKEL